MQYYFCGIGGSGMSPLATLGVRKGHSIAGHDKNLSESLKERFLRTGVTLDEGTDPSVIGNSTVVFSSAIASDHPFMLYAKKNGNRIFHRMDYLVELVRNDPYRFAIAGTHGKTSTSSMLGWTLLSLGLNPDIIVGGHPSYLEDGVHSGKDYAVFETDESDGSFLKTESGLRLCLNVDHDHLDYYGSFSKLSDAFIRFAEEGVLTSVYSGDPVLKQIQGDHVITFGSRKDDTVRGEFTNGDELDVFLKDGSKAGTISLKLIGKHFALNALGLFSLLYESYQRKLIPGPVPSANDIIHHLNKFPGVARRLELIGKVNSIPVYDDYGHHPTEIKAVLDALKGRYRKVAVVFQPHRYTRTQQHADAFAEILQTADEVYLMPLYSAGEKEIVGVHSELIAGKIKGSKVIEDADFPAVFQNAEDGKAVLFLGAGSISSKIRSYLNTIDQS